MPVKHFRKASKETRSLIPSCMLPRNHMGLQPWLITVLEFPRMIMVHTVAKAALSSLEMRKSPEPLVQLARNPKLATPSVFWVDIQKSTITRSSPRELIPHSLYELPLKLKPYRSTHIRIKSIYSPTFSKGSQVTDLSAQE